MLDEPVEQVPGSCLDANMVVVDETNKILQNLRDILRMSFKNNTVPDADFHVLEDNGRVREIGDSYIHLLAMFRYHRSNSLHIDFSLVLTRFDHLLHHDNQSFGSFRRWLALCT